MKRLQDSNIDAVMPTDGEWTDNSKNGVIFRHRQRDSRHLNVALVENRPKNLCILGNKIYA